MPLSDEVLEAFAFFDNDDNQYLEFPVFEKMVQSLGETPTKNKLTTIFNEVCEDGKADKAKIEQMWPAIVAERKTKHQVEVAFKVFDNRGEGYITDEQFATMLKTVGETLSAEEYQAAFEKAKELSPPDCIDMGDPEAKKPAIQWKPFLDWMMP